jgi:hypothetical protein
MNERSFLRAGAVTLVVVAAAGNVGHTYDLATRLGQAWLMAAIIALLPDILLVLSIIRLQLDPRNIWAWLGVAGSTAFVAWASVASANGHPYGWIPASAPLFAAIVATGMLHMPRTTHAPDQHVPSRVHVEAAVRVGVDRGHADHATPQLAATPPTPAPHVDPPTPRPAVEATPPTDPREAAYHAWLTDPTTWPVDRVERDFTLTRKAAGEQIRRWRQRAEREATPPGAHTLIRSSLDGPEAHE